MSKTKLRIHLWGESILRKKCKIVKEVTPQIKGLLDEMFLLMRTADGVGLAATQVGLDISIVVIEFGGKVFKLINPKIIKKEGKTTFEEGCLSFPGIMIDVVRSEKIWVESLDENGNQLNLEVKGVLAVIMQHEIDHVNGVVYNDRISFIKRFKLSAKLRKIENMARIKSSSKIKKGKK